MHDLIKEISQISIYLQEDANRINEVALFQPWVQKSQFNEEEEIATQKWHCTTHIPLFRRFFLKLQSFLFKHLPALIPAERLTPEAKFKTVLAMLLAQETARDFFLSTTKKQNNFFQTLQIAAESSGYHDFAIPSSVHSENATVLKISRQLTYLNGKKVSLIDDLVELNLQIAALGDQERSEILYRILNGIERPPILSVIEITSMHSTQSIPLTTKYAKYKIISYDKQSKKVNYSFAENQATSSIRTLQNCLPDAKGAINQRVVYDSESDFPIGSYSGELSTPFHVLEQILLIGRQTNGKAFLLDQAPAGVLVKAKKILFTSLYSWHEIELITDQQIAIKTWDQKILKCGDEYYQLCLLYYNIPFSALNKYPSPGEIKATIQDINDEAFILLIDHAYDYLGLRSNELKTISQTVRELSAKSFLERGKALFETIDAYRALKHSLLVQIDSISSVPFTRALKCLLTEKKRNGRALKGVDQLLYLDYVASFLGYFHNKNCENATDRSAGADAADKAQYSFQKIYKSPFLPGYNTEEEKALFKVLYSMYLVWEEPEINAALNTGFVGGKLYNNQKNPETTHYLVWRLKKCPEMYQSLKEECFLRAIPIGRKR